MSGPIYTPGAHRELIASSIRGHLGRVVDASGDNILAEFGSVINAVQCAVEVQRNLGVKNARLPDHRRMQFRIGINLGDVVIERERIYGDGVNIAARIEGMAEAGGVCVSGTVYDQIVDKLNLRYASMGEQTVKNMKKPVRVYRVQIDLENEATRKDKL